MPSIHVGTVLLYRIQTRVIFVGQHAPPLFDFHFFFSKEGIKDSAVSLTNSQRKMIHRPIVNRFLYQTTKNMNFRVVRPITGIVPVFRPTIKTSFPCQFAYISDQSRAKPEPTKDEVENPTVKDASDIDLSQFTEEVPIYLPGAQGNIFAATLVSFTY